MPAKAAKSHSAKDGRTRTVEWVLGGISAALIIALAGFLVYEGLAKTGSQPLLSLSATAVTEYRGSYSVEVAVRNEGHATAAEVQIAGLLDGDPLVRHATIDYVPAESERVVTLTFAAPVTVNELELFVLGFVDP